MFWSRNYYENEDYELVEEPKKINKYYIIDTNILSGSIKNLKRVGLPIRQQDFRPKTGVLGELNEYFLKNKINY